jgi:hypothetical protein
MDLLVALLSPLSRPTGDRPPALRFGRMRRGFFRLCVIFQKWERVSGKMRGKP